MAPGFIPGIGDLSGLAPGVPNRRTAKSGEKIADDFLKNDKPVEALSDGLTQLRRVRTYFDLLSKPGHIHYSEGEARLLDRNGHVDNSPLGMIFVNEKPTSKENRILENQKKAPGQAYDINDGTPYVPALRYLNKDGRNFIRFDGYEIEGGHVILIDRKSKLTDFHMIHDSYKQTLDRVRDAVAQNNRDAQGGALFKVAYDFDEEVDARKFEAFIKENGYSDFVSVRVRKNYE